MILSAIKEYLISFIESVGYSGVFISMFAGSAMIPIPMEVVMPLAGALTQEGKMNFHGVVIVSTIGNITGSLLAYWIGTKVNEKTILKFIRKWGKFVLFSEHDYMKGKEWVQRFGSVVSFIGRFIPGVRAVVSLTAGVTKIKLAQFVVYTAAGSLIWNYVLTFLGAKFGENWEDLEPYFKRFELLILGGMVVLVGLYVYWKLRKRSKSE